MSTLFIGDQQNVVGDFPNKTLQSHNAIVLTRCQILDWRREPIFHGTDYLYTRHALRIRALYNPGVNAWTLSPQFTNYAAPQKILQGMGFNVSIAQRDTGPMTQVVNASGNTNIPGATLPYESAGAIAPVTDVAVRHRLARPRQQIVLVTGGTPVLVSPNLVNNNELAPPGMDVKGGPFITGIDVVKMTGGKSFFVDLSIETWVNEFAIFGVSPNVLLSNRWSVSEDIDEDYYSTRTIRGVAHFRRDNLAFLGFAADEFRAYLVHPLPGNGWKRIAANFTPADDDTTLSYVLVDKQLALSIVPPGVTRIEATQTVEIDSGDTFSASFLTARAIAARFSGGLDFAARSAAEALNKLIPRSRITIDVRVWGRSDQFRKTLENVAMRLILVRLVSAQRSALLPQAILESGVTTMRLTHNLAGTFVSAVCTREYPLPALNINDLGTRLPNAARFFPSGDDSDDTEGVLTDSHDTVPPMGLPTTFAQGTTIGSRGTYLMKLATAALLAPDGIPTFPVAANTAPSNIAPQ